MYSSLKENWKKSSSEGVRIEEMHQKTTKVLFTRMPELLEYRQKHIQAAGMQAEYKQQRAQYKMTEGGKMHIIYIGEEMKIANGKLTTEKTKQEQMDKSRGKALKGDLYRTDQQWTSEDYTAVRMLNNKEINLRTKKNVTRIQTVEEAEKILKI